MDTVLDIMVSNLGPEKDPDVRLKFFTMLSRHLLNYNQTTTSQRNQLQMFVKHIIEGSFTMFYKKALLRQILEFIMYSV